MSRSASEALSLEDCSDDAITASYRLYQRRRGHRYSLDDVLTAWESASAVKSSPKHVLDLGCGIGSVLLMLADRFVEANLVGIEAQLQSFLLAQRNVARNDLNERVQLIHGDLRESELLDMPYRFDLITGTPPYFKLSEATPPSDDQKRFARFELRGGVEAYIDVIGRTLSDDGHAVICASTIITPRVEAAVHQERLGVAAVRDVIPRAGREPLFRLWTIRRERGSAAEKLPPFVARDAQGCRTVEYVAVRAFFGLPSEL